MSVFDEPKVDTHCHVLDPARFPYNADTPYRPAGQEIGTAVRLAQVFEAHGVRHGLLVGPNSGYERDNRCMLDAIANGGGRFKGIAVAPNDVSRDELLRLRAAGVVGVAFNATFHGVERYLGVSGLLDTLDALGMCVSLQVEGDQLLALAPMLERSGVTILIDHCGRPAIDAGVDQPGFRALLGLARTRRVFVKLSGYIKFSRRRDDYADALPFLAALLDAYTPDGCMWASDWPYLRAPEHVDYAPLLQFAHRLLPAAADRRKVMWETPCRVLGFAS
jgi:predicted TIM-barrel fold metal-dependent hydrolase